VEYVRNQGLYGDMDRTKIGFYSSRNTNMNFVDFSGHFDFWGYRGLHLWGSPYFPWGLIGYYLTDGLCKCYGG
jgi:hypothetical protein